MEEALDLSLNPVPIVRDEIEGLARGAVELLPGAAAALVVLLLTMVVAWIVSATVRHTVGRSRARPSLVEAMRKLAKYGTWIAGLLIAAMVAFPGLTPTDLLAGLGIGSIAVGLAFKDIFENFLAGFLILLRRPMRIGDDILCEGLSGKVENITIRDTHLRKRSGELVVVPNSTLFKNPVEILTDRALRRITVVVGIAYGEDVDEGREVIRGAVTGLPTVSEERPVEVYADTFNSSSIDYTVRWWTRSTPLDEHRSRDEVVSAIKRGLDEAGIEIPFPYRTLVVHPTSAPLPLANGGIREAAE